MEKIGVVACVFAFLLLLGCVSPGAGETKQVTKEELGAELGNETLIAAAPGLISVRGDENISVVTAKAEQSGGKWRFPMTDYDGQFESVGLYSTAFIRLDRSRIGWLGNGEAVWLTVYRGNGSGVLFNAIYSNEMIDCASGRIGILGKDYALSELQDKSSFQLDDKWKVARDPDAACPKRIIIYLDGYFDGMKNGEYLSLFRNDNTVLLGFKDLGAEPELEVIAAKPAADMQPVFSDIWSRGTPEEWAGQHLKKAEEGADGFRIEFQPPLALCEDEYAKAYEFCRGPSEWIAYPGMTGAVLPIGNARWGIFRYWRNETGGNASLILAKEEKRYYLADKDANIGNASFAIAGGEWPAEASVDFIHGRTSVTFCRDGKKDECHDIGTQGSAEVDGWLVHQWGTAFQLNRNRNDSGLGFAVASVLSEKLDLSDHANNVTLEWEGGTTANPLLKSIFVPRSSQIFAKLTGGAG